MNQINTYHHIQCAIVNSGHINVLIYFRHEKPLTYSIIHELYINYSLMKFYFRSKNNNRPNNHNQ